MRVSTTFTIANQISSLILMTSIMVMRLRSVGDAVLLFFFSSRRRHTRFDCDWSSDVCSSDLYAREIEHRAYERGYREGLEEGRNDARKGRNYAPSRHGEFRDADDGYNRRDGDREFYRRVYRRGFEVGYRESFDRNARYRDRDWRR